MSGEYLKDLENKVVVITGSTSGIGEGIAILFAKLGSKVVIVGRNEERIKLVSQKCESISPLKYKPLSIVADLTIDENVKQVVNKTIETFERIDVVVTAAGFQGKELFCKVMDPNVMDAYKKIMEVDVRSVLLMCQLTLPHLIQSKGCIVNISSLSTIRDGGMPLHAMSKVAIDMLTKVLAFEFAPKGVRVNTVNPGPIVTPAWYNVGIPADRIEVMIEEFSKTTPIQRLGKPEDIANAVAYLASNSASFATGTHLVVDGGTLVKFIDNYDIY